MKNFFLIFLICFLISCKSDSKKNVSDWINLFDGTSLEGWRAYNGNEMPPGWMVIDSILTFTTDQIMEKDYDYKIINPSPLRSKKFVISSTLIRKELMILFHSSFHFISPFA